MERRSHYREWAPPTAWHPAVRCRWEQRIDPAAGRVGRAADDGGGVGAGHAQRVIPDGSADVIVEVTTGAAVVVGPASRTVRPVLAPGSWYRGLRLRSEALRAVLDVDGASLRDATVPLDALVSSRVARALIGVLSDPADDEDPTSAASRSAASRSAASRSAASRSAASRSAASRSAASRSAASTSAGLNRRLAAASIDPRVRAACDLLWRAPATPLDEVTQAVGVSGRQLRRLLLADTGVGPKALARVGRLHRFLTLAERPGEGAGEGSGARFPSDLAGLALAAGYADQPHLTREVHRLTDLTPARLLAERRGTDRRPPEIADVVVRDH